VSTLVEDVGGTEVPWVLRLAAILKKKPTAAASPSTLSAGEFKGKPVFINPFDPPEKALTVGHLSDTHTLVLNKFNVVEHHIIVITRTFQLQTDPLNKHDLDAAYAVLRSMPEGGLAFFNCGNHSGRSQPHKHVQVRVALCTHTDFLKRGQQLMAMMPTRILSSHKLVMVWRFIMLMQIVPLPLLDGQPAAPPTAAVILGDAAGKPDFEVSETRSFPFRGYCCKLSRGATADQLETAFHDLLHAASASTQQDEPLSYNWLGCEVSNAARNHFEMLDARWA
jgi:ATP adenylyltransferase